jgi:16S rRNA (guanine527-N7)-methyltransferase
LDTNELFLKSVKDFDIDIAEDVILKFFKYKNLLIDTNKKFNLTRIIDDVDIVLKHFVDSLSIAPILKVKAKLLDIGSGAGFPGMCIAIVRGDIRICLMESSAKKHEFLTDIRDKLNLSNVSLINARAEDVAHDIDLRQTFDIVTARAVARLPMLLELAMPFVKLGGVFIAMKTRNDDELSLSKNAIKELGGIISDIKDITIPYSSIKRRIIIIEKNKHTDSKYPRNFSKITKNPIM